MTDIISAPAHNSPLPPMEPGGQVQQAGLLGLGAWPGPALPPSQHPPQQRQPSAAQARPGRARAEGLTLDDLRPCFHLARESAAVALGLTVNELKKYLKTLNVARW